jgi:hypothetical protein
MLAARTCQDFLFKSGSSYVSRLTNRECSSVPTKVLLTSDEQYDAWHSQRIANRSICISSRAAPSASRTFSSPNFANKIFQIVLNTGVIGARSSRGTGRLNGLGFVPFTALGRCHRVLTSLALAMQLKNAFQRHHGFL